MNWGKSIVLAFVLFALFIGTLVVVCLRQDIPLVAADYYDQELKFQDQLDRMKNTNALEEKPVVQVDKGALEIQFSRLPEIKDGALVLFRPSDARLDRKYSIQGAGSTHRIDLRDIPGGMYKARMTWRMDGKEYFLETAIYL